MENTTNMPKVLIHMVRFLIVILGMIVIDEAAPNERIFFSEEPKIVLHFGSKTPYRAVANYNDSFVEYPDCYPLKVFGIIRHGTRTPSDKVVRKINQIISTVKLKIDANEEAYSFMKDLVSESLMRKQWSALLDIRPEKLLTEEGEKEMVLLAQRLQNRFPALMSRVFSNVSYAFRYTDTSRAKESARYFAIGLFGEEAIEKIQFPKTSKQDHIIRFYRFCDRWKKEVKMNPLTKYEMYKYKRTAEVHEMLSEVSSRLRLNYTLSFDTVHLIFTACAFETAWYPHKYSPWCSPFEIKDLEVIDYFEELKFFWRDGYGFDINHKQACPLLHNAMDFLLDDTELKASFSFTHSGTLLKVLSHMGLYKDDFKLTHDMDPQLRQARMWKVSQIDSFGNNLVFVFFRCKDGDKLLTLHQERPVKLSGCPDEDLCPLLTVRKIMPSSKDYHCDFAKICSL